MTADDLDEEAREALAIYADALRNATSDSDRESIRQAIREAFDPGLIGSVICARCAVPMTPRCGCPDAKEIP